VSLNAAAHSLKRVLAICQFPTNVRTTTTKSRQFGKQWSIVIPGTRGMQDVPANSEAHHEQLLTSGRHDHLTVVGLGFATGSNAQSPERPDYCPCS
jgi:hypothetical protein